MGRESKASSSLRSWSGDRDRGHPAPDRAKVGLEASPRGTWGLVGSSPAGWCRASVFLQILGVDFKNQGKLYVFKRIKMAFARRLREVCGQNSVEDLIDLIDGGVHGDVQYGFAAGLAKARSPGWIAYEPVDRLG